jgi:hypothetical protein
MTGCQFSFTCDGALLRAPMQRQWHEAQEVARMALAGNVERSVGSATHYHADYVLPKWAFTLAKIEQIGRHIFYRFTGSWGSSLALNGRYSGVEQIPHLDFAALRLRAAEHHDYAEQIEPVPGLTVPPEVTDRHAVNDVGGRLDMTKTWRLSIPDPVAASSQYRKALGEAAAPTGSSPGIAAADSAKPGLQP